MNNLIFLRTVKALFLVFTLLLFPLMINVGQFTGLLLLKRFQLYGPDAAVSVVEKTICDTRLVRPLLVVEGDSRRLNDKRCSCPFFFPYACSLLTSKTLVSASVLFVFRQNLVTLCLSHTHTVFLSNTHTKVTRQIQKIFI